MKKFLITGLFLTAISLMAHGQPTEAGKEKSSDQTKQLSPSKQLDLELEKHTGKSEPGVAVMVIKDSEVKYRNFRGVADLDSNTPITADTPFYIASIGKQFTAVSIMTLAERSQLSYDDKLVKYFPEFASFAGGITIRHILTHTSGLIDHLGIVKDNVTGWTNEDVVKLLQKENRVIFQPGEKVSYSNSGYVLLSMIVEKISGESFAAFLKKNFFGPLKMAHTYVAVRGARVPDRVRGYTQTEGKWVTANYDAFTTGSGAIYSTLDDLEKWDRSFYTERLIKASTLKLASTANKLNNGRETEWGFGWLAEFAAKGDLANVWYVASIGDFKGFKGILKRIPERRFTVIALSNNGKLPWGFVELAHDIYAK